jgi:tetratricopeptide (TPR) repeat protein
MGRPRTNICLNMIVKNEEKVLPRLFRSLQAFIDYFVIVDTGSTDGTMDLIHKEMAAYGIPGEVHERPWVNFGVNRQQALELALAADRADWLLFIDADEELGVSDPKFYEKLEPGVSYDIEKHNASLRYAVPHLMNVRGPSFYWTSPVHNLLVTKGIQRQLRKDVWIIYHPGEGAKSQGVTKEQKYLRDARILADELAKDPTNTRNQFFLGQSYRDAGHLEQAQIEYQKRAQMDGWAEEKFMAQLEVGRLSVRLKKPTDLILSQLLEAYTMRPIRAEPLYELAAYFCRQKMYPMATLFAKAGVQTPRPTDRLFVNESVYTWRLWDELAVSTYWVKDYTLSLEATQTILERVDAGLTIPEGDLARIRKNHAATERKLTGQ